MHSALTRSLLTAFLATHLLQGCSEKTSHAAPEPLADARAQRVTFSANSPQLATLATAVVQPAQAPVRRLTGRLVWDEERTVRVYSAFAGRVQAITVKLGDRVAAGSVLATVGSPDFGQAQSEARRALADFTVAQGDVERLRDLVEHGVAAAKDLQAAEAEFERARSELARVDVRKRFYGGSETIDQRYLLRAPLAGVVVEKNINPGQEVRADQVTSNAAPLFVITDPLHLWVQLDATERDAVALHTGQMIEVHTPALSEPVRARVDMVSDFVDPGTRMVRVRASVANRERALKAEMFVTAEISGEAGDEVVVPAQAVFLAGDRHYVFVADGEGRFRRTEVVRKAEANGTVSVQSALKPGQRVVTGNALLLQQLLEAGG